jgi:alpha-1,3-rhamnosyl/mannosyltransferase
MPALPRITIDATSVLPRGDGRIDGIGRVTLELLRQFADMQLPFRLSLFTQRLRGSGLGERQLPFPETRLRLPRWDGVARLTRALPVIESMAPADLYHVPHNYAPLHRLEDTVATVCDTLFLTTPEPWLGHAHLAAVMPAFAQRCRGIITISEYSKRGIVDGLGVAPEKVTVVPLGVRHDFFQPPADVAALRARLAQELQLTRPFFFAVSCDMGRKNTERLLRCYAELLADGVDHDLVLAWPAPPPAIREQYSVTPYAGRIHFVGVVDDARLRDLYSATAALVFPSTDEGFGLPVIEGMACGALVITSDVASMPEAGGDAALYIDPHSDESITDALAKVANADPQLAALREAGPAQASRFRWRDTALATIAVYEHWLAG